VASSNAMRAVEPGRASSRSLGRPSGAASARRTSAGRSATGGRVARSTVDTTRVRWGSVAGSVPSPYGRSTIIAACWALLFSADRLDRREAETDGQRAGHRQDILAAQVGSRHQVDERSALRGVRTHHALVLENPALRHPLAVLRRTAARPRLRPCDRLFWALLSRLWHGWAEAVAIVQPETVIRWTAPASGCAGPGRVGGTDPAAQLSRRRCAHSSSGWPRPIPCGARNCGGYGGRVFGNGLPILCAPQEPLSRLPHHSAGTSRQARRHDASRIGARIACRPRGNTWVSPKSPSSTSRLPAMHLEDGCSFIPDTNVIERLNEEFRRRVKNAGQPAHRGCGPRDALRPYRQWPDPAAPA